MDALAPSRSTLVGRDRELAVLRERLAAALAGSGSCVLIGGEAGVGKTSLAEVALAEAAEQGALILVGRCYDLSETPPYGPWVEALARVPRGADLPASPDFDEGGMGSQGGHFARVRDYLDALAARQPLVILLDDLHWGDPASLELLRVVARHLADLPLLLLVTYRDDEVTPRHPLYALLPLLEREGRAARLDLRRLDATALRALVGRYALPTADATRLVGWLAGRAEGNAFFTVQLLRALEDGGVLADRAGGWVLGDPEGIGLPTLLRQVLAARLARLGTESQRLLALAAVIGQEVPLALWATIGDTDEDRLLDTVDAALEARLVVAAPDGTEVRFAHALIREALYEGLAAPRRRRVHRRVGETLAATSGDGLSPDPDTVAHHFRRAGDTRAAAWLILAGERAQRTYAYQTAAARYEAALDLLAGDETQIAERGWLFARLAWMRQWVVVPADLALADEAARLAVISGDSALATATRFVRGWLLLRLGEVRAGLASIEAAATDAAALQPGEQARLNRLELLGGAAPAVVQYRGVLLRQRALWGPFAEVVPLGERLLAEAVPSSPGQKLGETEAQTLGSILVGLALARAMMGRPAEAARAFAEARDVHRTIGHHARHFALGASADLELHVLALPYRTERAAERRRLAMEVEVELGQAAGTGLIVPRFFLVPLLVLEGAWTEARALVEAHIAGGASGGQGRTARAWLGVLARAQGEPELSWAQVRELLPDGPETAPDDISYAGSLRLGLPVALALDAGDLPLARRWLVCYDRWLAWGGTVLGRPEAGLLWAAFHRAAGDIPLARKHAEAALASASDPRQPLVLLAAHRALGEIDTAADHHETAAAHLAAALALADACGAPYERALTLLALAESRAAGQNLDGAREVLGQARALLEPLGARPALARVAALENRLATPLPAPTSAPLFGLTEREVEVLRLAAQGLPSAEIAARLFVTPRTIGSHLTNIYTKLGVEGRAAAIRLALDHGLR